MSDLSSREDWFRRDRMLLDIVARAHIDQAKAVDADGAAKELGTELGDVVQGLRALEDAEYVAFESKSITWRLWFGPRLRERGLRELGRWPASGFDAFVAVLEERIAAEHEPVAKSRLMGLLDEVKEIGRDVLADVITAVVKSSAGLP